jgi:hypothetical protein
MSGDKTKYRDMFKKLNVKLFEAEEQIDGRELLMSLPRPQEVLSTATSVTLIGPGTLLFILFVRWMT